MSEQKEFEFVQKKLEEENLTIHRTSNLRNDDNYVELKSKRTGDIKYKINMKNKEEWDKVVDIF